MMIDVKSEYDKYEKIMPIKKTNVNGGAFPYRYYKNLHAEKDVTLVFLAGGTGLADSVFLLFRFFIDKYSLLTFNYPQAFETNMKLADALAELFYQLDVHNVYLVGQSYGGLFAQVMAKRHPELVKGLILSGTCSMHNDLTYNGITEIVNFINPKKLKKNLRIDKLLPTKLLPLLLKLAFKKVTSDKAITQNLSDIVELLKGSISNSYWRHMDLLLGDLMNEYGTHKPVDFESFCNEVLLIFSEQDKIFSDELKNALIRLMPQPAVIRNLEGGHLALLVSPEDYVNKINSFIAKRN
ncbi:alpha/beta hydrolase [Acetobacterium carbinolicum]|uniref:alpha/beta hydrolase n=1 Tax=Acetobacterium carbinolicum TaxID=52690 RepID=UPI0039BED335